MICLPVWYVKYLVELYDVIFHILFCFNIFLQNTNSWDSKGPSSKLSMKYINWACFDDLYPVDLFICPFLLVNKVVKDTWQENLFQYFYHALCFVYVLYMYLILKIEE